LEEQNVQNSQVGKRGSGFYDKRPARRKAHAELETLIAAEAKGRRIILDLKI
jgi:hypothetical protein